MASWTTPTTRATGFLVTASVYNADLVNNIQWLHDGLLAVLARKATSLDVSNTVAETDLLNGEFTLAANALPANGLLRLIAWGDHKNSSGSNIAPPRFKYKMGSGPTTIIDTGSGAGLALGTNTGRYGWKVVIEMMALGATNSQWTNFACQVASAIGASANPNDFATGEGRYGPIAQPSIQMAEGGNASAIDTTASQAVQLTVIQGIANANTDTKLYGAILQAG